MALFYFALLVACVGLLFRTHLDLLVTLLPINLDSQFVLWYFPKDDPKAKNTGATTMPLFTQIIPKKLAMSEISKIFEPSGHPVHVRNIMEVDQDLIVSTMTKGNAGKMMRMLDYSDWKEPHLSPSCGILTFNKMASFDEYSINHLFTDKADNHSYLYAGFETITDPETIESFTGLDVTQLGM